MADLDVAKLSKLLQSRRVQEAQALLDAFLSVPLTATEKSAAQFALASAYLELQAEVSETYESLLSEALQKLKDITTFERKAKDRLDLARVNAEIDALSKKT